VPKSTKRRGAIPRKSQNRAAARPIARPSRGPVERIGQPVDEGELRAFADIGALAFGSAPERVYEWMKALGPEVTRVCRRRGAVVGGLILQPMGQWFGGRSVPMTGVAMVCVAPQHRASGIGAELMRAGLREIRARGVTISTLYAATAPLYRRVGYEAAGGRYEITLPTGAIGLQDRTLTLRETEPGDGPALDEAHRRRVACENGPLDPSVPEWRHAQQAGRSPQQPGPRTYAAWNRRRAEGYVRYLTKREGRTLHLMDFVATTPGAGRRLLTFLADHRSTIDSAVWHGAPADPMLLLLPEHSYRVRLVEHWLLRVVDVPRALEARGYPETVSASVALRVEDELFPANRGPFVLEVAGGAAQVRRGRGAGARIDIRGLAALYTGHLTAAQLAMTDYLEATPAEVAALQAIFAGPTPWMSDAF
jgi:predicted acetyltransferase